jgi:hypothetical protein
MSLPLLPPSGKEIIQTSLSLLHTEFSASCHFRKFYFSPDISVEDSGNPQR